MEAIGKPIRNDIWTQGLNKQNDKLKGKKSNLFFLKKAEIFKNYNHEKSL